MQVMQRRLRIFGFEPDCGGAQLVDRVLRSLTGVTAARFDERRQAVCIEFHPETVDLKEIIRAVETTGFRATESREPLPLLLAERSQT